MHYSPNIRTIALTLVSQKFWQLLDSACSLDSASSLDSVSPLDSVFSLNLVPSLGLFEKSGLSHSSPFLGKGFAYRSVSTPGCPCG